MNLSLYRTMQLIRASDDQVLNPTLEARIASTPGLADKFLSGIPAPTDVQCLAVLLASDASQGITGAIIPMDGGSLRIPQ